MYKWINYNGASMYQKQNDLDLETSSKFKKPTCSEQIEANKSYTSFFHIYIRHFMKSVYDIKTKNYIKQKSSF